MAAVTAPGDVAIVGAASPSAPGAPASITVEDLARGALHLTGGSHRFIDGSARRILLRPSHASLQGRAVAQHADVVRAVVAVLRQTAPQARILLAVGGPAGSGAVLQDGLRQALQRLTGTDEAIRLVALADNEIEPVDVPDGGEEADTYPVPVVLRQCDVVVNVARFDGPLSGLRNLAGMIGAPEGVPRDGRLLDALRLTRPSLTIVDLLGRDRSRSPLILASGDGVAVDRIADVLTGRPGADPLLTRAGDRRLGVATLARIRVTGLQVPGTWAARPGGPPDAWD